MRYPYLYNSYYNQYYKAIDKNTMKNKLQLSEANEEQITTLRSKRRTNYNSQKQKKNKLQLSEPKKLKKIIKKLRNLAEEDLKGFTELKIKRTKNK